MTRSSDADEAWAAVRRTEDDARAAESSGNVEAVRVARILATHTWNRYIKVLTDQT